MKRPLNVAFLVGLFLVVLNDKTAELEKFKNEKSNASLEKSLLEAFGYYNNLSK